jgi:hypothetical protein
VAGGDAGIGALWSNTPMSIPCTMKQAKGPGRAPEGGEEIGRRERGSSSP